MPVIILLSERSVRGQSIAGCRGGHKACAPSRPKCSRASPTARWIWIGRPVPGRSSGGHPRSGHCLRTTQWPGSGELRTPDPDSAPVRDQYGHQRPRDVMVGSPSQTAEPGGRRCSNAWREVGKTTGPRPLTRAARTCSVSCPRHCGGRALAVRGTNAGAEACAPVPSRRVDRLVEPLEILLDEWLDLFPAGLWRARSPHRGDARDRIGPVLERFQRVAPRACPAAKTPRGPCRVLRRFGQSTGPSPDPSIPRSGSTNGSPPARTSWTASRRRLPDPAPPRAGTPNKRCWLVQRHLSVESIARTPAAG